MIDVGGGAVPDATVSSLSQIPLNWMVREIVNSQCGILFDAMALKRNRIDISYFASPFSVSPVLSKPLDGIPEPIFEQPTPEPVPEPEPTQDVQNAMQPIHDELKLTTLWWILELIPLSYTYQDGQGVWHKLWRQVFHGYYYKLSL